MCDRCDAESADYAAKAEAAYAANGWRRVQAAIRHEDELANDIADRLLGIAINGAIFERSDREYWLGRARFVIDAVRAFDEHALAMRDAKDDHTAQNNETEDGHDYY